MNVDNDFTPESKSLKELMENKEPFIIRYGIYLIMMTIIMILFVLIKLTAFGKMLSLIDLKL